MRSPDHRRRRTAVAVPLLALLVALLLPAASLADNNPKPGTIVNSEPMELAALVGGLTDYLR